MMIIVLVKQVPDTYGERKLDTATGLLNRSVGDRVIDEINERALETPLSYKDSHNDAEIIVLSMGPAKALPRRWRWERMQPSTSWMTRSSALTLPDIQGSRRRCCAHRLRPAGGRP